MKTETREAIKPLLLSMLMPGLGQIYNGSVEKAGAFFLGFAAAVPLAAYLSHGLGELLIVGVVFGIFCAIGAYLYACVDAFRGGNRQPDRDRPHLGLPVYISLFVMAYGLILHPLTSHIRASVLESYYAPSASMTPNLLEGDLFFADKSVNRPGTRPIRRGDIVLFINPDNRTTIFVKRVVGLPGDTVTIKDGILTVNGNKMTVIPPHAQKAHWVSTEQTDTTSHYEVLWPDSMAKIDLERRVPHGTVFVLGDNRGAAKDSRHFGPIPSENVVGIAKQVFWSKHAAADRIGTWLDLNGASNDG